MDVRFEYLTWQNDNFNLCKIKSIRQHEYGRLVGHFLVDKHKQEITTNKYIQKNNSFCYYVLHVDKVPTAY